MTEQNQNNNNDFAIMNDVTICLNHFMYLQTLFSGSNFLRNYVGLFVLIVHLSTLTCIHCYRETVSDSMNDH